MRPKYSLRSEISLGGSLCVKLQFNLVILINFYLNSRNFQRILNSVHNLNSNMRQNIGFISGIGICISEKALWHMFRIDLISVQLSEVYRIFKLCIELMLNNSMVQCAF